MKKFVGLTGIFILMLFFMRAVLAEQAIVTLHSGLRYQNLEKGTGATAEIARVVVIHLTGWLDDNGRKGEKFFSTYDQGKPISFKLGTKNVMPGLNEGVIGMKVGGRRRLMIPARLGYGEKGAGDIVPPNADLIFDIELIEVR